MPFDFDHVTDRRDTDSVKWRRYAGREVLPMWVADMDFPAPPPVLDAMRARLDHGVFGYAEPAPSVIEAVMAMLEREYHWPIQAEWLAWTPGVAVALHVICRMLDQPTDAVLTSTPIYPPFLQAPGNMGRALRSTPLVERPEKTLNVQHPTSNLEAGRNLTSKLDVECSMLDVSESSLLPTSPAPFSRFHIDFDALADALAPPTRAFLFCHPQNPTGRVWSRAELERVAEACLRHDLLICSDEVHNGLILDADKPHIPFASLAPEVAARTITLMSASKTYNVAGLMCAFAIIPDAALRRRFQRAARGLVNELNPFGYVACEAAYRHGEPWRQALLEYLRGNRDLVQTAIAAMPGLRMNHVEATYLAWIDCRAAGFRNSPPTTDNRSPTTAFESAGVGLSDGAFFGAPGWVRLNFGCPRATLREALTRMSHALSA